jgi:hypothetical protein
MRLLDYHPGQLAVQTEANTRPVAEKLRDWIGPVTTFAEAADLVAIAAVDSAPATSAPAFTLLSGAPPLVAATLDGGDVVVTFPRMLGEHVAPGSRISAIVINAAAARRSRVGGTLQASPHGLSVRADAAMTHCRKYIAPSVAGATMLNIGPRRRVELAFDDPRIGETIARAETAFLATVAPDGSPVAAHRGGQPGFIDFDPATGDIRWPEFVGDGMFVNTGNLRVTRRFALVVLDFATGNGIELCGAGDYTTLRTQREARAEALLHLTEAFAVQGEVRGRIEDAVLLEGLFHPRQRTTTRSRVTSSSEVTEQAPR